MKLSIVIVSWNTCSDVITCLSSVYKNPPQGDYEVIVVDNASSDGTVAKVREKFPEVKLIENEDNVGFSKANNQGIKTASGEYILLLNPDTIIKADALDVMIEDLDKNLEVGAVGPKLICSNGQIQQSIGGIPTFRSLLYGKTILRSLGIFRAYYKKIKQKNFDHEKRAFVEQLTGAAVIIRRSLLEKIGGFDESFFMYYEDIDLFMRIRAENFKLIYEPKAEIIHLGGQSSKQISTRKRFILYKYLFVFLRKNRGRATTALFNVIFKPGVILREMQNFIVGTFSYLFFMAIRQSDKKYKALIKAKSSICFLAKYSIPFLFS